MTISSQTLCVEARRKWGVGFIHTQLALSYANAPQQLASSRSTVGFITRDFHALTSRQHSQTNRCGLHTLFLTSKSRCMQKISSVDAPTYHTKRVVLIRSLRRRPYRMKPTAVGFISLTTVISETYLFSWFHRSVLWKEISRITYVKRFLLHLLYSREKKNILDKTVHLKWRSQVTNLNSFPAVYTITRRIFVDRFCDHNFAKCCSPFPKVWPFGKFIG